MFSIIMPMDPDDNRLDLFANTKRAYDLMYQPKEFVIPTRNRHVVREYIRAHDLGKGVRLIPYSTGANFNPAAALNFGVIYSTYPTIIVTCPEILPAPDVLDKLSVRVGRNVVCQVWNLDQAGNRTISFVNSSYRNATPGMYFLAMYNRADIQAINGWDEAFMAGHAFEDTDFGRRWVRAGLPFEIADDIEAEHQWHPPHGDLFPGASDINERIMMDNDRLGVTRCRQGLTYIT